MATDPEDLAGALFGRDAPLAAIVAVVDGLATGPRALLLVEGEAGIGKTSLVRGALARTKATVIWTSGAEDEADLDHGLIDQLVRAAPLEAATRRDLLAAIGGDPLRTGAAIVRLLDGFDLDRAHPLVVVVDDAHWADRPSLQALTFAARRLRHDPVLLCLIVRSEGLPRLPEGLVRLVDDEGTRLLVGPLDRAAVRLLAERATDGDVSAWAADRLLEHTRGNPLHLQTLLDELPLGAVTADAELPSPRSFSTLVLSRLAGSPSEVEALVVAVATLGEAAPLAVAGRVAGLEDPLPALDDALALGLLVLADEGTVSAPMRVATPHPMVRAAVLGDLPVERRAELHRRAGAVVEGVAGLRHRLLGAVGGDQELWSEAMRAARAEMGRGAHGQAAALLRLAAGVSSTQEEREVALLEAVDQLLLAGLLEDADALRPSIVAASPSARRSYAEARLAYIVGPRREAQRHLDAAWRALVEQAGGEAQLVHRPEAERDLAGRVAAMLATVSVDRASGEAGIDWCHIALTLAPESAALASTAHMLAGAYALALRFEDGLLELDRLCARLDAADGAGDPALADVHSARGLLHLWSHDLDAAAADLELSLAAATRGGSFVARETARFYLAEVRYRQGRWDDAVLLAQLSASVVDDSDQAWMAALPHATAAQPLAARGEPAGDHVQRAIAAAAQVGVGVGMVLARIAALEVAACERDHRGVIALGEELVAGQGRLVLERIAPWRASYVEALVAEGRAEEAADVAVWFEGSSATPLVRNDAARAAVVLHAARGDDAGVDAAADVGLALDPLLVGPYPRARLELAVGRAWRHRGERRRALALLQTSLERFRLLGARPWMEQVEQEIAASGLRPTRRPARVGGDLTPQEQAVAQLVARGLTNREAAAHLVVSAKTVEHHLSRIYAKLGVRSRTELTRTILSNP